MIQYYIIDRGMVVLDGLSAANLIDQRYRILTNKFQY